MRRTSNIYIGYQKEGVFEGGMARNQAFLQFASTSNYIIFNVYSKLYLLRVLKFFFIIIVSLFWKRKNIIIHIGSIFILFPEKILNYKFGMKLFRLWFYFLVKRNTVFLEVNDLPLEQAIDLNLSIKPFFKSFQIVIFNPKINLNYIFAANGIKEYVIENYKINRENCQVIINGAPPLHRINIEDFFVEIPKEFFKFIYAGSSQEGRGLEELLDVFREIPHYLFIIGEGGEWIKRRNYKNIIYLGSYSENEAANIVANCDIGIVHYDDSKLYYNICYPTKYSFYLSAGLPILSTELKEPMTSFMSLKSVCIFSKIFNWKEVIKNLDKDKIKTLKKQVDANKNSFYWTNILSKLQIK
ncbi:glycosyltransferase family protein [Epilithonimonas hominis]|uniref:Glucosyltransferase 3-like C-terminal domain-containing protein n=1 Tax=Epilithonimonas hominis TaxID=420404 RepID=A0A1H6KL21_9FLAO|nr:hypothetical protein [Epilithonimonas hominis]SEH76358.1 hypothetical protein SAMN05421793_12722 [Epilithonimonas hominis]